MNKKGQEGITLGTILLMILGAVVLVVIILGATGSLNFVFGKINFLPGQDLQAVVSSCELAASQKLTADYCNTFKEVKIDGTKQYVNCQDLRVGAAMSAEAEKISCPSSDYEKTYCESLRTSKGKSYNPDKLSVNGQTCTQRGVSVSGTP